MVVIILWICKTFALLRRKINKSWIWRGASTSRCLESPAGAKNQRWRLISRRRNHPMKMSITGAAPSCPVCIIPIWPVLLFDFWFSFRPNSAIGNCGKNNQNWKKKRKEKCLIERWLFQATLPCIVVTCGWYRTRI